MDVLQFNSEGMAEMTAKQNDDSEPATNWAEKWFPARFGYSWSMVPTGVRWTVRDILVGRYNLIIWMCILEEVALFLVAYFTGEVTPSAELADAFLSGDKVTLLITWVLGVVYTLPMAAVNVVVLYVIYNRRERREARLADSELAHSLDAGFHWSILLSAVFGLHVYGLLSLLLYVPFGLIALFFINIQVLPATYESTSLVIAIQEGYKIVLAEKIISAAGRRVIERDQLKDAVSDRLLNGLYEAFLPSRFFEESKRTRLCRLIKNGAATSVEGAIVASAVLDVRSRVRKISTPFAKSIEAVLSVFSFGAWDALVEADGNRFGKEAGAKRGGSGDENHPRLKALGRALLVCLVAILILVVAILVTGRA